MCGICGIVSTDPAQIIPEEKLIQMRDSMTHRGPDDAGLYLYPGVGLGSRRLSIIDLSQRGHMPMSAVDGRYWIAYNGEVYNFRDLRHILEAKGYTFVSDTDTEVLLKLYVEEGPAMLSRLNGMFAIAIWDAQNRVLFLARDRLGIKPLYYAQNQHGLYFASEEKALFAAGIPLVFDHDTWEELLIFRYVAGERTPYQGIKRLLAGHYLLLSPDKMVIKRWWNLADRARELRGSLPVNLSAWYQELFDDAVNLRRISDVPVGVLLSGGLDSSTVAASLASQADAGIASFTVRFDELAYDEGPLARQVVERWGLQGFELKVGSQDLLSKLLKAAWFNDEPLVHGNDMHLWAISEFAKERVTVLLSGEGADETMGGYVRYRPLQFPGLLQASRPAILAWPAWLVDGRLLKLKQFMALGSLNRFVFYNAANVLPADLQELGIRPALNFPYREQVLSEAEALYPGEPARQAMYNDQHTFLASVLDRNDRMTMGASIECRVPFLDYRLVETLAALPTKSFLTFLENKHLMRKALGDRLPERVRKHRKWGFGVPWQHYLRQEPELRLALTEIESSSLLRDAPLDLQRVRQVVHCFLNGDDQNYPLVLQLFMIAVTWRAVTGGSAAEV